MDSNSVIISMNFSECKWSLQCILTFIALHMHYDRRLYFPLVCDTRFPSARFALCHKLRLSQCRIVGFNPWFLSRSTIHSGSPVAMSMCIDLWTAAGLSENLVVVNLQEETFVRTFCMNHPDSIRWDEFAICSRSHCHENTIRRHGDHWWFRFGRRIDQLCSSNCCMTVLHVYVLFVWQYTCYFWLKNVFPVFLLASNAQLLPRVPWVIFFYAVPLYFVLS